MKNRVTNRVVFERYLSEREELTLMRYMATLGGNAPRRDRAWMKLLRQTGIRIGSLRGLTIDDARNAIASGTLNLSDAAAKGGGGYDVPANHKAVDALRELLAVRKDMWKNMAADMPLVISQWKRPISERNLQLRMQQYVADAGLSVKASPHWLRHTLAKRILARSEAADPTGRVQVILGHARRSSTAIYLLPDREEIRRELEAAS